MPRALIAWGTSEVLSAAPWSASNVSVTPGASDPFGGSAAFLCADTAGGASGNVARAVSVAARDATQTLVVFYAAGSAPSCRVILRDTTASAERANVLVTSAGVGTASVGRVGVVDTGVALSRQWWALVIAATGIVPANSHALELYPDGSGPAGVGSSYLYLRPSWTHGYDTDQLDAYPVPRPGSEKRRAASGVTDAWDAGTDEVSAGVLDWVPPDMIADPPCSGFEGDGAGLVGVGFRAVLRAARRGDVIRYVRDRADCTAFADGDLAEPYDSWGGTLRDDGTRSIPFRFIGTTPLRGAL